ncbi:MAG: glutamate synthase [Planctomycetes bacterium]|nr:glutamate synthase [Planctomycetota bacterium]
MAELVPVPFDLLVRRAIEERRRRKAIFDLPEKSFHRGDPALDLGVAFQGRPAGTPLGPASGPHGQLAQNIVLAWLGGARIIELKTVQVLDRLEISRPCIHVPNVGYNSEWSQELRIDESLREYVAGSMLIEVLAAELGDPRPPVQLDLSLGYSLDGIRSDAVRRFVDRMKDARATVESLRAQIPPEYARFRDLPFRADLAHNVTLSTFHGCPAGEIEAIVEFLLTEADLDVVIKMNPTLLGRERAEWLLHDKLGYRDIEMNAAGFQRDIRFDAASAMVRRLLDLARRRGRRLGVKMSNTLEVRNREGVLKGDVIYLSGQPLHVLALHMVQLWRSAFGVEVPISFSAGADAQNFPALVAMNLVPVTTCTDLLRQGGYARLPKYLARLEERMRELGVRNLTDYVLRACGHERETFERATLRNTADLVAAATEDPRYAADENRRRPRRLDSTLKLFDCVTCDKCIAVCPNDANFGYEIGPVETGYVRLTVAGGRTAAGPVQPFRVARARQFACYADACNECGNCDTFCPEIGGPYIEKPRFFGGRESWERWKRHDGFLVEKGAAAWEMAGRIRGREYSLAVPLAGGPARFRDEFVSCLIDGLEGRPLASEVSPRAPDGHVLDLGWYCAMRTILEGVTGARGVHFVNARWV